MNDMIERVVKTLRDIDLTVGTPNYYQIARAVIETMREPTVSLLYAGSAQHADLPFHQTAEIWQAMINEALK